MVPLVKWLKVTPERKPYERVKFVRTDWIADISGEAVLGADGKWRGRVYITLRNGTTFSWDVCKDEDAEYCLDKAEEKAAWLVREVLNGQIEDLYEYIANRPKEGE